MSLSQERITKVQEYLKANPEASKGDAIEAVGLTRSQYYSSIERAKKSNKATKTTKKVSPKRSKAMKNAWRKRNQKMLTLTTETPTMQQTTASGNRVVVLIGLPKDVFETLQGLNF